MRECFKRFDLRDDVELATTGEQERATAERLQMPRLLARHLPDAFCHGAHFAAIRRDDRQNAIRLAEVTATQNDSLCPVRALSGAMRHSDSPSCIAIIAEDASPCIVL